MMRCGWECESGVGSEYSEALLSFISFTKHEEKGGKKIHMSSKSA